MSEYDLVCDVCGRTVETREALVTWVVDGQGEHDFALVHVACASGAATERQELRLLAPNTFLRFVTDRFGKTNPDPEPLRAIAWALAPFVMRHDNPSEMDLLRAASFGAEPGVKPGDRVVEGAKPVETGGGK